MAKTEDLKWLVAHDPCRVGDRNPVGAVLAGTSVDVRLRVDVDARSLLKGALLLVGQPAEQGVQLEWHPVAMDACPEGFAARLDAPQTPQVLFYAFLIATLDESLFFYVPRADGRATAGELVVPGVDGEWTEDGWAYFDNHLADCKEGAFAIEGPAPAFQLTVYEPAFATPDWLAGCVMYQIFPDRFARGSSGVRKEGLAYHGAMDRPVRLHEDWNELPDWEEGTKCEKGSGPFSHSAEEGDEEEEEDSYDPVDFFGGTLEGIREKLPYLASLGVELVYLNPICEARSNHRYDTADYERVDPLLGSDEDFERLCAEASTFGIRIIIDAVLSHTGDDSRYFNAKGTYAEPGALQGPQSPYYGWYDFEHPTEGQEYRCWWGFPALPEVDEQNPSWQRYVFGDGQGAQGVLPLWLSRGASGFRLDVADEIPDEVLERLRTAVKGARPDAAIIGEVWEDATTKVSYGARRTYALGRSLDSVMNYPLRSALLGFATGFVDAQQLAAFLMLQQANYPEPLYRCAMNLLSSHDVERVRSVLSLGGPVKHLDRMEQLEATSSITAIQDELGARLQVLVAALLYALPGMPCIYYGDECGLQGGGDPFCRATFPWDGAERADCGCDLTTVYRELGMLRKASPALRTGALVCFANDPDVLCLVRTEPKGSVPFGSVAIAAVNRADEVRMGAFDAAGILPSCPDVALRRIYGPEEARLTCESDIVCYSIPPCSVAYFELRPKE